MDKTRAKTADCIFNITLEIIYLLTGEDYTLVKKTSGECVAPSGRPCVSGGWSRSRGHIPESPNLLTTDQKIIKLANKMIQLLSGEVPIRCQDVAVYLSMEEWEYIEGHRDLYPDVMMEKPGPLTPADGSRNPAEGSPRPLDPQNLPREHHKVRQDENREEDLLDASSEDTAGREDSCVMADPHYGDNKESPKDNGPESKESSQKQSPLSVLHETVFLANPKTVYRHENLLSERIAELIQEIIHLLTRKDYTLVMKTSGEFVAPSGRTCVSGGWSRGHIPESPNSLIPESNNEKKILELTNKMMELLSREVPIRCQDVAVYLSMEEWEYIEGHRDLYPDVIMEKPGPLTPADESRNPAEKCPSPDPCPEESPGVPEDLLVDGEEGEDLLDIKVEVVDDDEEETYMMDEEYEARNPAEESPLSSQDCPEEDHIILHDHQGEDLIDIKVEVVDEDEMYEEDNPLCKEEESSMNVGCHSGEYSLLPPDSESEDNIEQHFSYDDPLMLNIRHDPNPLSDSLHPEEPPEKSHMFTQNTDHRVCKIFPCSECGRHFARKANLFRHKRSHTRPFFCGECGKSFTFKFRLLEHQRFHTGEKPFACPECGKRFMHKENLFKHQKIHNGERPFSCMECGKSFSQKSYLVEHLKFHMGEKPYSCSECGKPFSKKSVLVKHLRIHAEEKPLLCLECGRCFAKKSMLVKHQRSHVGHNAYICSECGKCFKKKSVLVDHQRTHTGERPFPCLECGKSFTKKSVLVAHQRIHTGEKPYSCPECEKCFTQKSGLIAHQKVHEGKRKRFSCLECGECKCICSDYVDPQQKTEREDKPFLCLQCGKCFTQKAGLVKHQRIHTGDRPFSCSECGKCFTLKDRLERHQRSHSGEKPFSCSDCGKSFTHKSSLVDHQRTHTGERPFPCLECGKCFIQKSDLVRHQRIHSGEKPFSCSECGKSFIHRSDLVVHQRIHTGEKLYSCPECGRGFTRKSQFEIHQRSHTGERPFTCPECGKCFNQKSNLVRHQGTHYISKAAKMALLDGITIDVPHSQIIVS